MITYTCDYCGKEIEVEAEVLIMIIDYSVLPGMVRLSTGDSDILKCKIYLHEKTCYPTLLRNIKEQCLLLK